MGVSLGENQLEFLLQQYDKDHDGVVAWEDFLENFAGARPRPIIRYRPSPL
jgi:Ca2+-binding EF-hand superfamily protein